MQSQATNSLALQFARPERVAAPRCALNYRPLTGWVRGLVCGLLVVAGASVSVAVAGFGDGAGEPLPRRATLGAGFRPGNAGGMAVTTVVPTGAAAKAGLKVGDEVVAVAGAKTPDSEAIMLALRSPKGATIAVEIVRGGERSTLEVPVVAAAAETMAGSAVRYDSVEVPAGYRLRTIISEPEAKVTAANGKRPALLFIQGIYCASLDRPQARDAVDTKLVTAITDAGFVTMRVDKPGLGDSEGPPCGEIDFATELAGYIAALKQLKSLPNVDPDRVFVFGHSMGGVMAPFVTKAVPVKGVIVYGTLARTWLEYSLENTRRQAALRGVDESQGDVSEMVQQQSRIDTMMLIQKMTLGEIWDKHPELKPEQSDPMMTRDRLSSRSMGFYHQLQDQNIARAWEEGTGSVLAIHGEYDWVTTGQDHELIAAIVSGRKNAGSGKATGTMLTLPKADHAFTTHNDLAGSLQAMGAGRWADGLPTAALGWIDTLEKGGDAGKPVGGKAIGEKPIGEKPAGEKPAVAKPSLAEGEKPKTEAAPGAGAAAGATGSASPVWEKFKTERYAGKQDDVFFISPAMGWYVNGAGKIFKTTDGGATWVMQLHKPGTYFRCIGFVDEKLGFAGNIGPGYFPNVTDTAPLYRTEDGGTTWTPVTTIEGPAVVGLCAIEVDRSEFVNAGKLESRVRIVAGGRVGSPAAYIYSDDLGTTWQQVTVPEACKMIFDVHFTDREHGFIAGATSTDVAESNALILATGDGGKTWAPVYQSSRPYELTWKISFPTKQTGYVTIQSYNPDTSASKRFITKTTDGGKTWAEIPLVDDAKVRQFGVAFVSENEGWVGAMPGGFYTADGGKTWGPANFGNAVNKIRVVRDVAAEGNGKQERGVTLFAIGVDVSKLRIATGAGEGK